MSVAFLQGLTDEEHEELYLDSFHTKVVTLMDGTKLDCPVALNQLRAGVISLEDVVNESSHEQCKHVVHVALLPFNVATS
jgi:hypothetical protein